MNKVFIIIFFASISSLTTLRAQTSNSQLTRGLFTKSRYVISEALPHSNEKAFGATFYKQQIVFAKESKNKRFVKRKGKRYLDLFVANRDSANKLVNPIPFSSSLNKKLNEGPATFNAAGDYVIYTTNDYQARGTDNFKKLQLKESKLVNGKWLEGTLLPFNNKEYSIAHASLSPNGNTVYFVSDMPGGHGGTDVYRSERLANGNWGPVQNLGSEVNTAGNEMFPFVHPKGQYLYFSSEMHSGHGGLDVYIVEIRKNAYSTPKNVGKPVNGPTDDFAFVLNKDETYGYFASNRKGGDKIFHFTMREPIRFESTLTGVVINSKGEKQKHAKVTVTNKEGEVIGFVVSNSNGEYSLKVPEVHQHITIKASKKTYLPASKTIVIPRNTKRMTADIQLDVDPCNFLNNQESPIFSVHFDFDAMTTEETMALDSLSNCMRVNPRIKMAVSGHTDSKGTNRYNYMLGNGRVGFVKDYLMEKGVAPTQLNGKSYGEDRLIEKEDPKEKKYRKKYRKNRRVELKLIRE